MTLDWREMFFKYSDIVGANEGVDFLQPGRRDLDPSLMPQWTDEEWAAIKALMEERNAWT